MKEVKDYQSLFKKVSENLDSALNKNAQVNKNKPADAVEAENFLAATRSCFNHTTLDYVNSLTMMQAKKKPDILSTLLSYVQACSTYYHQGSDLCEDYDPFFKGLGDEIGTMRADYNSLEKSMQNRHASVNNFNPNPAGQAAASMAGYLFKRTSKGFKSWNRRWFYISGNQLLYRKRSGDDMGTVMEEDLSICAVRLANENDRRFCFEVISPSKSHMLQADSMEVLNAWMVALQSGIGNAIQNGRPRHDGEDEDLNPRSSANRAKKVSWEYFLTIPGNGKCCDCGHTDPKWASINLGITLCIACSGVHRSLGVHYSKVRSLTLDAWEPEIVKVMTELGNNVINRIYEAKLDESVARAHENSDRQVRENWIKAKYVERRFVSSLSSITEALGKESVEKGPSGAFKVTRWSVKRLRRRLQSTLNRRLSADTVTDTESIVSEGPVMGDEEGVADGGGEAAAAGGTEEVIEEKDVGDEKQAVAVQVVFGENLSEPLTNPSFVLDSDEDSVGGGEGTEEECGLEDISHLNPDVLLYKASFVHNLPVMSQSLALGASKVYKNAEDLNRTYLHQAVLSGSVMAVEYLLLNGVEVNAQDENGYTALHLATERGNTAQAYLLLKNRAKHDIPAANGKQALDIAVDCANADIVTL